METKRKPLRRQGLWILIVGLLLSLGVSIFYFATLQQRAAQDIERVTSLYTERTENLINNIFHKTDVLAAVVKLQNGDISEDTFNSVAQLVYKPNSGIRGIQYMPGAVVTYSYPVAGNEGVIGKNFLEIPERRKDVMLAIDTKSTALSGPYNLLQGGLGVVARNPVFLTDESGKEYFWGFSAIILDLPDALEEAGLGTLPESGYDFQLYCINENNERLVIEGDPDLDLSQAVYGAVQVPHHQWTLAVVRRDPWMDYLKAGIAMLAGAFISFSLWYLYRLMLREKEATRAKDLFFSNISHDMRTPLNAVIGFASLAQKPGLSEAQKDDYLKKISTSGNLLLDLVNDTLSISRMTNGKYRLSPEPVSTQDLGASILPSVEALAKAKGITFYTDDNSYRPRTILADRLNTEKIFLNLLTNAVKYTPPGGHIWASVADDPPEGANPDLVFTIRDDGIGMSEAFIKELYEPFAQENRPGYESKGTGLGLAIVRELVDLMGGTIAVTSQMDCGTTFVVRLHFDEITAPALPEAPEETEAAPAALTGKRILLCEDNALNQEIACAFLKDWGLTVTTAADGQAGIDAFTQNPPDTFCAVLMDLRMPVLNGYDAARAIRALDRSDAKTIPIIAMSADAFADDVRKCRDAGMDGHIAKPIDVKKLHSLLTALCQSRTGP